MWSLPREAKWGLSLSTALLVLAGYLALAATSEYGVDIVLIPAATTALAPLCEWLDQRSRIYRRVSTAITIIFSGLLPYVVKTLGLLHGVIVLVIFIQVHKSLHRKTQRDYYHLFLMAFFLLLAACIQSPGASMGLVFVLFLVASAWAFFMLLIVTELSGDSNAGRPATSPSDTTAIYSSAAGRSLWDRGLIGSVMGICLASMLITVVLFLVTPRMEAGLLGRTDRDFSDVSGLSSSVELDQAGLIVSDPTPIMRVEFPEEPQGQYSGEMLWRSTTFDIYTGTTWKRADRRYYVTNRRSFRSSALPGVSMEAAEFGMRVLRFLPNSLGTLSRLRLGQGREVHQSIFLDELPPYGVPCLNLAREVVCKNATLIWDHKGDATVIVEGRPGGSLNYEVISEVDEPSPDELRRAPDINQYKNLMLPSAFDLLTTHHLEPRSVALAEKLTASAPTVYDKVLAIEQLLQSWDFLYLPEIIDPVTPNPVDSFLHITRRGHCAMFAGTMALMLRSIGIPTRVVSGYRGGEWNPEDRSYIVRAETAHLWVEILFLNYGWVPFDPSPPAAGLGTRRMGRLARFVSAHILKSKIVWYRNVVGFNPNKAWKGLRSFTLGLVGFNVGFFPEGETLPSNVAARPGLSGMLQLGILMILGLAGAYLARRLLRRKAPRQVLTPDQLRAVRLFIKLRRKLQRQGGQCEGKTAEEILAELLKQDRFEVEPLREVLLAYNMARFGQRPMGNGRYVHLRRLIRGLQPLKSRPQSVGLSS
jgi:hypothetical protein